MTSKKQQDEPDGHAAVIQEPDGPRLGGVEHVGHMGFNSGGTLEPRVAAAKVADATAGANASMPANTFEQRVTSASGAH
jgi:hypothetical protein